MKAPIRRGRLPFGFTLAALLYSVCLLVWVAAIPAFDGETLLRHGGPGSLAITAQPLVFSLLIWALLHRRCTTGSHLASAAAWVLGTLFALWSVLGALTLAAGAFPAAALLLVAVAITSKPVSHAS